MNKQAIINSILYPIICGFVNLFGLNIRGNRGVVSLGSRILFRKTRIRCHGSMNTISIGDQCRFRNFVIEIEGNNNSIEIGENVMVYEGGYLSIKGDNCIIIIGNKTTIGQASLFAEEDHTSIHIGADCMLGRKISICTTDFHSIIDVKSEKRINHASDVVIGNHVWIGTNVDINKGTLISDNSVVGSCNVVTKQFDKSNIIVVGIPAKIVKQDINWSRKKL